MYLQEREMYILPQTSQSFYPTLEFASIRAGLHSAVSQRCRMWHFKHRRRSSPQVCYVASYYLLILLFCILSWIEVQQQQTRYHTSCCCSKTVSCTPGVCININSHCCLPHGMKLFPPMVWANKGNRVKFSTILCLGFCPKIPNITNLQK